MDTKFINLKFESNNKTLKVGKNESYRLLNIDGIDSGEYELNTTDNVLYDGSSIRDRRIKFRSILVEAEYSGRNTEDERRKLAGFFNIHHNGILTINYAGTVKRIKYAVESFKSKLSNLYKPLKFLIHLYCPNPFWQDIYESGELISTWIKGFQFPLKLPFQLRQRGETKKDIYNEGDVETPVDILFKGPAVNPSVTNLTTKEFIRVKRTLTSDDTLYITTERGNKKVEIERENGTRENAFHYIDLDSVFFSLQVGDNLIEYNTENLEPQSVEIRYRNRYLGM